MNTDRTTEREARFVEEGHHAVLDRDEQGPYIRVVSETLGHRGIAYKVRALTTGPGRPIIFDCVADGHVGADGHPPLTSVDGVPPCKHAAGAARRLGRQGFATPVAPGVHGALVTRDTRWMTPSQLVWQSTTPLVVVADEGGDPGRSVRVALLTERPGRGEAMTTAAEGPGGNPFAGMG